MDETEIENLCGELRALLRLGPGVNDAALSHGRRIIEAFRETRSGDYVNEKLLALADGFERWFSARDWETNFDAGAACRQWLYSDIGNLGSAMGAADHPRSKGSA